MALAEDWEEKYLKFPTEYIQRVAKDLVRLVEDIKYGSSHHSFNPASGIKIFFLFTMFSVLFLLSLFLIWIFFGTILT